MLIYLPAVADSFIITRSYASSIGLIDHVLNPELIKETNVHFFLFIYTE